MINNACFKQNHIAILLEQVGKSSLIATFVSRYFDTTEGYKVPGVMTRVQLPPTTVLRHDWLWLYPSSTNNNQQQQQQNITTSRTTVTTILVDSQCADVAFQQQQQQQLATVAIATIPSSLPMILPQAVDSILLVHDLSRPETLTRLEQHWLPLIEQVYQGKVRYIIWY